MRSKTLIQPFAMLALFIAAMWIFSVSAAPETATKTFTINVSSGNNLFTQPNLAGIVGNLYPGVVPHTGIFGVDTIEINTTGQNFAWGHTCYPGGTVSNSYLYPTTWDAGTRTGFHTTKQLSYQPGNVVGSSVVQAEGGEIGVYLDGADLFCTGGWPNGTYKFGVFPEIWYAPAQVIHPFASNNTIDVGFFVQIPWAVDGGGTGNTSNTYGSLDLLFVDQYGNKLSFDATFFYHNEFPVRHACLQPVFDVNGGSNSTELKCDTLFALGPWVGASRTNPKTYLTLAADSTERSLIPWSGYRYVHYTMSLAQFQQGINDVLCCSAPSPPPLPFSLVASDWGLEDIHANIELHYKTATTQMGWSMKGLWVAFSNQ